MTIEERTEQARRLTLRINETIRAYAMEQEKAGTPILGNDILGALACSIARMIANIPNNLLIEIHQEISKTILYSVQMHREDGAGAPITVEKQATVQ